MLLAPGGAIFLTVMAFNFFGDGLRARARPAPRPGRTPMRNEGPVPDNRER